MADDPAHHRTAGQPDSNLEVDAIRLAPGLDLHEHRPGERDRGFGLIAALCRSAGCGHVGVAHGLDLLDAVLGRAKVEPTEKVTEQGDDALWVGPPTGSRLLYFKLARTTVQV